MVMHTLNNSKKTKTTPPKQAHFGTTDNLVRAAKAIFPGAILTHDQDGEIIILTGYKETRNGRVKPYSLD